MRVNLKKVLGCGVCFLFLWLVFMYSSTEKLAEMMRRGWPNPSRDIMGTIDDKLNKLDADLKAQIKESALLLDMVKKQLAERDNVDRDKSKHYGEQPGREPEAAEDSLVVQVPENETPSKVLPILVIACDRVTVKRCLDNLIRYRPDRETFPIIVSQDCGHNKTYEVIKKFTDADPSISIIKQPDLSNIPLPTNQLTYKGYYKIARHYKFALNYMFMERSFDAVIIVEDDLDISPDFFEYFLGTYPLLLQDPSLWCVSAWNDNGKSNLIEVHSPQRLYRTDFFPGLGWLLRKEMWLHVEPRWPKAFFDDWLRDPSNTQGRACIRPEISRTYSFGKVGVSKGLYFDMHLRHMQLNKQPVDFTKHNLTYLLKPIYDAAFKKAAYSAPIWRPEDVISAAHGNGESVRVLYSNAKSFRKAAKRLGLMDDLRSGIPRTAYLGIVSCYIRGRRVYLTPDFKWVKYDPAWS